MSHLLSLRRRLLDAISVERPDLHRRVVVAGHNLASIRSAPI